MKENPSIAERMNKIETGQAKNTALLKHIIENDLKHIQRWIYGIVMGLVACVIAEIVRSCLKI